MNRRGDRAPLALLALVIDALAVYRLTRLIVEDKVTEPARERIVDTAIDRDLDRVAYLVTCPHCVGVYLAAGVVAARRLIPKVWHPVATALALAAVVSLIAERND